MERVFGHGGDLGLLGSHFLKPSPPLELCSLQRQCRQMLWLLVAVLDICSGEIWASSAQAWEEKVVEPRVRKQGVVFPESAVDTGH